MRKEMLSLGMSDWEVRANERRPMRLSTYNFALDQGPDNKPLPIRLLQLLKHQSYVSFTIVWCMHHATQLIVKYGLVKCEQFPWRSHWPTAYWAGISAIVYIWRGPSFHERLKKCIADDLNLGWDAAYRVRWIYSETQRETLRVVRYGGCLAG